MVKFLLHRGRQNVQYLCCSVALDHPAASATIVGRKALLTVPKAVPTMPT
jgi:hypothetical protein